MIILIVFILVTSRYQKEEMHSLARKYENTKGLMYLYPSGLFLLHLLCRLSIGKKIFLKVHESMQRIHVRQDPKERTTLHLCRLISIIVFLTICISAVSILVNLSETSLIKKSYFIKRPYYGEEETTITLDVGGPNEVWQDVEIKLQERHYTESEKIDEVMRKAMEYLDKIVIGDNVSYEHVTKKLSLVREIPNLQVSVSWDFDPKGIVSGDGKVTISEEKVEGILVTITATLSYYDTKILYPINVVVFPREKTSEEKLFLHLEEEIHNRQIENPESEYIELPKVIGDQNLTYSDNVGQDKYIISLLGIAALICIVVNGYSQLEKERKKKDRQMLLDYPDVINKLVLLVGAGMTIKNAWGKMCLEYENKCKKKLTNDTQHNKPLNVKRYVYEEMIATYNEILNGVTDIEAYDHFGRRVQLVPYMKLSSLLVQNTKKGTADLLQLLEYEAIQAFEERKEIAKRLGEEAGTKLLGPMVLMLFIVLAIIMIPAFMQM